MEYESKSLKKSMHEIEEKYKDVSKRKWVFRVATVLFVLFTIDISLILGSMKQSGNEKVKEEFLETQDEELLNDYYKNDAVRGNPEAMKKLEDSTLGISNNIALAGLSWNCNSNVDFHNTIENIEAYRKQKNGALVICVDDQIVTSDEYIVDELIATTDGVYFINLDDGYLWKYDVESKNASVLYEGITKQFAIVGNQIYLLNESGIIIRYSLIDNSIYEMVTNVQRLYVTGNLIVQSGADIVLVGLDGNSHSVLVSNALLVGANDDIIYYVDFETKTDSENPFVMNGILENLDELNKLYAMNVTTKEIEIVTCTEGFVRAVYFIDDSVVIDEIN